MRMFSAFRRAFRPNAHSRRVLSGLCAAFVLATLAFSSVFVTVEADHDCHGQDCPVCQEMQACVANFQLLGSALGGEAVVPTPDASIGFNARVVCAYHAPALTLQSLDVRFDE